MTKSQPNDSDDAKDIRIKADKVLTQGDLDEQSQQQPKPLAIIPDTQAIKTEPSTTYSH